MLNNCKIFDKRKLASLDDLISRCRKVDKNIPNVYPHILSESRLLPVNFSYTKMNKMMGFCSAFFFYTDSCEISILVDPSVRRRGLGISMFRKLLPFLQRYDMKNLIFSCPQDIHSSWMKANNFDFHHSEYYMSRKSITPVIKNNNELVFKLANIDNIAAMKEIDKSCFPPNATRVPTNFDDILNDREYNLILVFYENEIVGKAHIRSKNNVATLSDIGILPKYQHRGFGTDLVAHSINHAIAHDANNIDLDLEVKNKKALKLYSQFDFKIANASDYWTIAISQLPENFY